MNFIGMKNSWWMGKGFLLKVYLEATEVERGFCRNTISET